MDGFSLSRPLSRFRVTGRIIFCHAHLTFLVMAAGKIGTSLSRYPCESSLTAWCPQGVHRPEEHLHPGVPEKEPEKDPSARPHDLAGQVHEDVQELFKLHGQHRLLFRLMLLSPSAFLGQEQGEPRLDRPGQCGHDHIGPVAYQNRQGRQERQGKRGKEIYFN
jgi:hypothetical protein